MNHIVSKWSKHRALHILMALTLLLLASDSFSAARWKEITTSKAYQSLPPRDRADVKTHYFNKIVVPQIHKTSEFQNLGIEKVYRHWMQTPDDNGQDALTSGISSLARGLVSVIPHTLGGAGCMLKSQGMMDDASNIEQSINTTFPVNPVLQNTFEIKAANALGLILLAGCVAYAVSRRSSKPFAVLVRNAAIACSVLGFLFFATHGWRSQNDNAGFASDSSESAVAGAKVFAALFTGAIAGILMANHKHRSFMKNTSVLNACTALALLLMIGSTSFLSPPYSFWAGKCGVVLLVGCIAHMVSINSDKPFADLVKDALIASLAISVFCGMSYGDEVRDDAGGYVSEGFPASFDQKAGAGVRVFAGLLIGSLAGVISADRQRQKKRAQKEGTP